MYLPNEWGSLFSNPISELDGDNFLYYHIIFPDHWLRKMFLIYDFFCLKLVNCLKTFIIWNIFWWVLDLEHPLCSAVLPETRDPRHCVAPVGMWLALSWRGAETWRGCAWCDLPSPPSLCLVVPHKTAELQKKSVADLPHWNIQELIKLQHWTRRISSIKNLFNLFRKMLAISHLWIPNWFNSLYSNLLLRVTYD